MKYIRILTIAVVICFTFSACGILGFSVCGIFGARRTDYFGFNIAEFTVVAEEDTHGGFLGDGDYYLILDCSGKTEQAAELIKDWSPLPLTENLQRVMNMTCSGVDDDGVSYSKTLAEIAHWPIIENGVYKFIDRHSEAIDKSDDTNLFNRYSFNFSIAVYDLDTNTLYYCELDT